MLSTRRVKAIRCCCAMTACTIDGLTAARSNWPGSTRTRPIPTTVLSSAILPAELPVGLLFEAASHHVERVARKAHPDTLETDSIALARALEILNSYGVTGLQDAAVSGDVLAAYANLERQVEAFNLGRDFAGGRSDRLSQRHHRRHADRRSRSICRVRHINTTYVKIFLDGVPMSRTSAFIKPYLADQAHGCCFCGNTTKTLPELVRLIARQEERGLGVKIHAAGDGAVRMALDAIDVIRSLRGPTKLTHHIAHAGFVDSSDIARFKSLNVVADLSPILWFPNQIIDGIEQAVGERVRQYWPNRSLDRSRCFNRDRHRLASDSESRSVVRDAGTDHAA